MMINIESETNPEENPENEKVIRVNGKELKLGDHVNFDNGDGLEKDWILGDFDNKKVKVFKYMGPRDANKKIIAGEAKILKKYVPIDQFIGWQ